MQTDARRRQFDRNNGSERRNYSRKNSRRKLKLKVEVVEEVEE